MVHFSRPSVGHPPLVGPHDARTMLSAMLGQPVDAVFALECHDLTGGDTRLLGTLAGQLRSLGRPVPVHNVAAMAALHDAPAGVAPARCDFPGDSGVPAARPPGAWEGLGVAAVRALLLADRRALEPRAVPAGGRGRRTGLAGGVHGLEAVAPHRLGRVRPARLLTRKALHRLGPRQTTTQCSSPPPCPVRTVPPGGKRPPRPAWCGPITCGATDAVCWPVAARRSAGGLRPLTTCNTPVNAPGPNSAAVSTTDPDDQAPAPPPDTPTATPPAATDHRPAGSNTPSSCTA